MDTTTLRDERAGASAPSNEDAAVVARLRDARVRVKEEMAKVVVGQDQIIDQLLVKFDGALRLFHLHGEGMGLVIIATTYFSLVVGQPVVTLDVTASEPVASLSVKLCDVFPDGTSALIIRGTLDLRDSANPVELVLDACAYRPDPGHRLRLSVAGADWPNTIAPPAPLTLTVHGGTLELPLWTESGVAPPA